MQICYLPVAIFLLCSVISFGESSAEDFKKCPKNEERVKCINKCNNCKERGHCMKKQECIPGCDCKKGFLRDNKGHCIPEKHCEKCPKNEVFTKCVNPCNDCFKRGKCDDKFECKRGCDCKKGFLRNKEGKCIPEKHCPVKKCKKNEVFTKCVNPCNDCIKRGKCDDKFECKRGCDCKKGFFRNKDRICVPEKHCPKPRKCGKNAHFSDCASKCPKTCEKPERACPHVCVKGCVCDDPKMVFNKNGDCVPRHKCPKGKKCEIPKCGKECYLDFEVKPCPICKCDNKPKKPFLPLRRDFDYKKDY